jgi:hypothetical protein
MSDITALLGGEVNDSGKVNWRGDQVSAPIGQSIYKTSSVKLAELGARVVVGDRVFRYSLAAGAINAGDLAQQSGTQLLSVTAGDTNPAGGKVFSFYFATSNSADVYTEGTLFSQSGTAANMGHMYRIKSQPVVATTSTAALTLYDPLVKAVNVTDKWSIQENPYKNVTQMTAGTAPPVGVAPILVTSADYFWAQTWGPAAVKSAAAVNGENVHAQNTGQVVGIVGTTASGAVIVGWSMQTFTASERGLTFLTIAP